MNTYNLRERAERALQAVQDPQNIDEMAELSRLFHELDVHRAELEIQNEELLAAQYQLELARGRFEDLYHDAPVGYVTCDGSGTIHESNAKASSLLAGGTRPLRGARLQEFVVAEDRDLIHLHLRSAVRQDHRRVEVRGAQPPGGPRHLRLESNSATDGGAVLIRVALTDISDLKRGEARLRDEEAHWRAVFATVAEGILSLDVEGRIEAINPAGERLFGRSSDSVKGLSVSILIPALQLSALGGEHQRLDLEAARENGTKVAIQVGLNVYHPAPGLTRWIAVARDVSEQRRVDQQLRRLADVVRDSSDAIIVQDLNGKIMTWNAAAERLYGYPESEVVGLNVELLLPPESLDHGRQLREHVVREKSIAGHESARITREGLKIEVSSTMSLLTDDDGMPAAIASTEHDVTAKKQQERADEQTRKMESLGRVASGVAHDFNNLLMAISGCNEIAQSMLPPSHEAYELVDRARQAALRGASLSRSLLTFGVAPPDMERRADLTAVTRGMTVVLTPMLGKDIELRLELGGRPVWVRLAESEVEQILMNLVLNARDAISGSGLIEVTIGAGDQTAPPRTAVISIRDSGSGMPESVCLQVFEPFFTTKSGGQGTGLGLATVYGLVQQAGGRIEVKSQVGEGTCFRISLPEAAPPEPHGKSEGSPPGQVEGEVTILLLEDEPLVRASIRHQLQKANYRVLEAATGREALRLARENQGPINLLLSDVVLPDLRGDFVGREVRGLHEEVRVLMMSAFSSEQLRREAIIAPDQNSLVKPFTENTLLLAVQRELAHVGASSARGKGGSEQNRTVLLVEDDVDLRAMMEQALGQDGYRVVSAGSVLLALESFERMDRPCDLIITDFSLGDGDGLKLIERLRVQKPGLPALLISGRRLGEGIAAPELEPPSTVFLEKPFTFAQLRIAVNKLMS